MELNMEYKNNSLIFIHKYFKWDPVNCIPKWKKKKNLSLCFTPDIVTYFICDENQNNDIGIRPFCQLLTIQLQMIYLEYISKLNG